VIASRVLLPNSTDQVQAIVRICHRERIPFVARGVGTGLKRAAHSGLKTELSLASRYESHSDVDFPNARVVVEPGSSISTSLARIAARIFLRS